MGAQNLFQLLNCFSTKLSQCLAGVAGAEARSTRQSVQWCCCQSRVMCRRAAGLLHVQPLFDSYDRLQGQFGNRLWMF